MTPEEDAAITAAALSDPDCLPLTDEQLAQMVPYHKVFGRPRLASPKRLTSIRFSPEVLEWFRATGDGWQSRLDAVLRQYVARQRRRSSKPGR